MNFSILPPDLPIPEDDGSCKHLLGKTIPDISLSNQDDNDLKLKREASFRIVLLNISFPSESTQKDRLDDRRKSREYPQKSLDLTF